MGHLQIIKILDYIFGAINLLLGGTIFVVFFLGAGAFGLSGDAHAGLGAFIFGSLGTLAGGYFLLMGFLSVLAGAALGARQMWAKVYHIVIAILNLLSFPIGTAFGIYILWALLICPDTQYLFGSSSGGTAEVHEESGSHGGFNF